MSTGSVSSSGASSGARPSGSARMNIGQVLEQLRPDFPGVTIPKIRFLEDKGLIKPERTPAGYRKFSPPPIEPVVPTVPTVALAADGMPSPESFRRRDDLRLSRKELLKVAEVSEELLEQLEQFGLVSPRPGTGHYDTDALVVVRTARELADFGIEPRHLRAFKAAADREVGLVQQVVAPLERGRDAAASARAADAASEIAALSVRLHATLVKTGLSR